MATSRIKQLHLDLLAAVNSLVDSKGKKIFKYCNIWDNQIDEMILGSNYAFALPALFIEFIPGECKMMGMGMSQYPQTEITFHIVNQILDGNNDTMERNLPIFDLRDLVKAKFVGFGISFCSNLMCCYDKLDYKHGNTYKYLLSFNCNFIDSKGSGFDPDSGLVWGYLDNPTLNINIVHEWISGKFYNVADAIQGQFANVVIYRGQIYQCSNPNFDIIFDSNNWFPVNLWTPRQYNYGDMVLYYSYVYSCVVPNNDTVFNSNNWIKFYS